MKGSFMVWAQPTLWVSQPHLNFWIQSGISDSFFFSFFSSFRMPKGSGLGGVWGVYEGLRNPDAKTSRLKINSVLNACGRRGPFLGNSFGVVCESQLPPPPSLTSLCPVADLLFEF